MLYLEKNSEFPLYQQLYEQLRQQISEGILSKGVKLPSTRTLSAEYHVSRNTVIQAYQQLEIEGYVRSIVGSGYYVENLNFLHGSYHNKPPKETFLEKPQNNSPRFDFYYGNLDYNCYRSKVWRRCLTEAYDRIAEKKTVSYSEPQGLFELRQELANYLHFSRGVQCLAEQIILTGGHGQSLSLLARLFSNERRTFAMENPGYDGTRIVMQQHGFSPISIPLEHDGISVKDVKHLFHTLLYITPSHQFPMGSVLPIAKRLELLQWAVKSDSYILEDDYDSELRYHSLPIPSLQSIDKNDRVIYMGTFSKSLSPDLRIAYLVLPKSLLSAYHAAFAHANCGVSSLLQYALMRLIRDGEYQKHINIMRTHYQKKHDYILNYFKDNLTEQAVLSGTGAGLHFILNLKKNFEAVNLIEEFANHNIAVYPLSRFWSNKNDCPPNQFLLGYGALPLTELPLAMETMGNMIHSL